MKARKSGFTLIEILIVVIILGILAAIVIPQFTEASSEARESTLVSNLHTLRSQIGLYKVQHDDILPGDTDADGVPDDAANFEADLVGQTTVEGAVGTEFGPYMQNVPENPFITDTEAGIDTMFSIATGAAPGDNSSHWYIDDATGNIWANDDESNSDDIAHSVL